MSTRAFLHGLLTQERGLFLKVVKAVLEDGLDYRPDPKARSSRDLIEHLIGHNLDVVELIDDGVIHHRNQVPFDSLDDGVKQLDDSFGILLDKLDAMEEDRWMAACKFFAGEHLVMEAPCEQMAWMLLLDSVHHRGQLTTHLRPMGSTVPALYGPSADDQGGTG